VKILYKFKPLTSLYKDKKSKNLEFLFFLLLVFTCFWELGTLEFFRHTEADRTLISWEMIERGDYLVPHLVSSEILTKPPLFYWFQAAVFKLTGTVNEFTARIPSQIAFCALFWIQVYFNRRTKNSYPLETALITVSTMGLVISGAAAEIDMLYVALTTLSINLLYCGSTERNRNLTLSSYFVLAFSFLTKGPPAILFFGVGLLTILVSKRKQINFTDHIIGGGIFLLILFSWIVLLSNRVGWYELYQTFYEEIIYRAINERRLDRGWYYYLYTVLIDFLPWSLVMVLGMLITRNKINIQNPVQKFNFTVFGFAFVFLSLMSGKSNRYLFPVYPFAVNLIAPYIATLLNNKKNIKLYLGILYALFIASTFVVLRYLSIDLNYSILIFLIGMALFASIKNVVMGLSSLILVANLGFNSFFLPYRNSISSVKDEAVKIQEILKRDPEFKNQILNIEFFDRWVNYYLKKQGVNTSRVEKNLQIDCDQRCYILLSDEDESWRLEEFIRNGFKPIIHYNFNSPLKRAILISVPKAALEKIKVRKLFPTKPSKQYF